MEDSHRRSGGITAPDEREDAAERPSLGGVAVREEDIETTRGIKAVARLFRGMAILLLLLMAFQVFFGLTSTVPVSLGVLLAEAVRLIIFAGLLWGAGDMAVLLVKSHSDIRANKILTARIAHMIREIGEKDGKLPPEGSGSRADRKSY